MRLRHLAERPEGDAVAVGQTSALTPVDEVGIATDDPEQLPDESRLADSGHTHESHELRRSVRPDAGECTREQVELTLAADQLRAARWSEVDPEAGSRLERLPDWDRRGLSLRRDRLDLAVLDRAVGRPERLLADQGATGRSGRLDASSRVHDVASNHRLPELRACPDRDEGVSCVDTDSYFELRAPDRPRSTRRSPPGSRAPHERPAPDRPHA